VRTREQQISKITVVSILWNVILSGLKISFGFIGQSFALVSDGFHSVSDVLSSIGVLFGIRISSKEADEDHPYGHEKIESLTGLFIGLSLIGTAIFIGYEGVKRLFEEVPIPDRITLWIALCSILVKEGLFWYTKLSGKKLNSVLLEADAWHHRSDALSSIATLIGISLALVGFPIFDPIVSIIISIVIAKVAITIMSNSINQLVDKSCTPEMTRKLFQKIEAVDGVIEVDDLMTRMFGHRIYVDVEIACNPELSLKTSHDIATKVHDVIEHSFEDVKHIHVHVNPYEK
jgi:cation diffusion facilitator family transporter